MILTANLISGARGDKTPYIKIYKDKVSQKIKAMVPDAIEEAMFPDVILEAFLDTECNQGPRVPEVIKKAMVPGVFEDAMVPDLIKKLLVRWFPM